MVERCKTKTGSLNARCIHFEGHPGPHTVPNQRLKDAYPDLWGQLNNETGDPVGVPAPLLFDLQTAAMLDFIWDTPEAPKTEPPALGPEKHKPVSAEIKKKAKEITEQNKPKTDPGPKSEPEGKTKRRKKSTTKRRPAKRGKK